MYKFSTKDRAFCCRGVCATTITETSAMTKTFALRIAGLIEGNIASSSVCPLDGAGVERAGGIVLARDAEDVSGHDVRAESDVVGPVVPLVVNAGQQVFHRSEEHTSELQSLRHLVCRLL